jgi:RNA recognition motif-containing protein
MLGPAPTIDLARRSVRCLFSRLSALQEKSVTTRLHIGNIPSATTNEDLGAMFRNFGPVASAGIMRDQSSGLNNGCGFVEMCNDVDAESAIKRLNFSQYGGRTISVSRSRTPG